MDDAGEIGMSDMYEDTKAFTLKNAERILGLIVIEGFRIWIILIGVVGMDLKRTPYKVRRLLLDLWVSKFGTGLGNFQRLQKLGKTLDCRAIG